MSNEGFEGFVNTIPEYSLTTHSDNEGLKAFSYINTLKNNNNKGNTPPSPRRQKAFKYSTAIEKAFILIKKVFTSLHAYRFLDQKPKKPSSYLNININMFNNRYASYIFRQLIFCYIKFEMLLKNQFKITGGNKI